MGRMVTLEERVVIAKGEVDGLSDREVGVLIGRDHTVVWRERRRNRSTCGTYRPVAAQAAAEERRRRPQARKVDSDLVLKERVVTDLRWFRSPRMVAGRLRAEALDATLGPVEHSPDAGGATVSHEALYRWIYALPKGDLAEHGEILRSKRTSRSPRRRLGERKAPIVGMNSIDVRPEEVEGRAVPGHWEGDLIIGKDGATACATLVERKSRLLVILALPEGKKAAPLADALIETVGAWPNGLRGSLTWDQGSEMAQHAALTLATSIPVYFAHPHSPWERGTNENTNRTIRYYLPKGIEIPSHQPYLNAIAEEINDMPRATLGYRTPREVFTHILNDSVATTT